MVESGYETSRFSKGKRKVPDAYLEHKPYFIPQTGLETSVIVSIHKRDIFIIIIIIKRKLPVETSSSLICSPLIFKDKRHIELSWNDTGAGIQ